MAVVSRKEGEILRNTNSFCEWPFLEKSIKYPLTKRQKNSILLWQLYAGVAQW